MTARWKWVVVLGACTAPLLLGACDAVFGIDKATLDPTLTDAGSDAHGGGGASGTTSSSGATGGGGGDSCASYCAMIAANCTGNDAEYVSDEICLAMCATFDPGKPGDTHNDSLACRIFHAKKAAADPAGECQKAGPLARSCTDPCDSFCILAYTLCEPRGLFPYDGGTSQCTTECASYPYLITGQSTDAGDVGDILFLDGNTLNCRLYHLESAYAPGNAAKHVHCPHTALESATCF